MTNEIYSQPSTYQVYDTPQLEMDYAQLETSQRSLNYDTLKIFELKKESKITKLFNSILNDKRKLIFSLISLVQFIILIIAGILLTVLALTGVLYKAEASKIGINYFYINYTDLLQN